MLKNISKMFVAVLLAILLAPVISFADFEPSTTDQGNAAVSVSAEPSTTDQGNAAVSVEPSTTDQGNAAVSVSSPTPSAPSSSAIGGGLFKSYSSGATGYINGYNPNGVTTINVVPIATTSCPLIKSYIKFGNSNDVSEVTKLQTFLKVNEGIDVDINGIFDQKTFNGVKAFQLKYVVDVMGPWGSKNPTGNVFVTTKNKINEIVCNTKIALTSEQLASINTYKASLNASSTNSTSTTTIEVGSNKDDSNTATVVKTSAFGKVKGFIKWLFGY